MTADKVKCGDKQERFFKHEPGENARIRKPEEIPTSNMQFQTDEIVLMGTLNLSRW